MKLLSQERIDEFRSFLEKTLQQGKPVIVDFSPVRYLMSSVLGALIDANKKSKAKNNKFMITGVHDQVFEVLQTIKLIKDFEIFANVDIASKKLQS